MYELCVSVFVCRCARVSVCEKEREREQECSRAHARTYTYTLLLFVSLFLFILSVTSFVSISLCMHMIWYNTNGIILSTHTHTHTQGRGYICGHYFQGARPHPTSHFHEQTEILVHNRVKRLAGQANGQRHAQYLLDLWLQGLRKQLANHLRHALWRKPSTMLRESTMTLANFS